MGKRGRAGHNSSSSRGRGQNSSSNRITKSSSTAAKTPAILLTAMDQHFPPLARPSRSPILTREKVTGKKPLAPGSSATGQQQQKSGEEGTSSTKSMITIPTINEYAALSDCGDDDDDDNMPDQQDKDPADEARKKKLQENLLMCTLPRVRDRPPLIHTFDCLATRVDELLIPPNVQYFVKVTKLTVQILTTDQANYDKALVILKANNVKFFTYDSKNSITVKIVLTGLAETPIPAIIETLKVIDITPREVKILSKKTTVTGTNVLYLLYFDKGTVKIQDLRRVKCLDGYLVNWRFFTKRPMDAAQCHRCQKFGHGSRNCNMAPRCVKCGKDHLTEGCTLPRKASLGENGIAEQHKPAVKCANCGGNHTANFRGCKARKTYIEQQEKKKTPVSGSSPSSTTKRAAGQGPGHPPGWGRSYASVAAGLDAAEEPDVNADGDLFSLTEFLILARDMYRQLSSCRNKQQQFMALSQLMMKYVCVV